MSADTTPPPVQDASEALVTALDKPALFDHPVRYIRTIETHISWVILTGDFAYKIKKAVDFGFLDFSSLEKRRHLCAEELRLNRRYAPDIYLDLVAIRGSVATPSFHGPGEIIEYAVKMREFPQSSLLSEYAARQRLCPDIIDAIADKVSAIHAINQRAAADSEFGSAAMARRWSDENIQHIASAIPTYWLPQQYFELKRWYREIQGLADEIEQRRRDGFVRECHGDLHLGNMALIEGEITLFDCIEFNPELRWIDCISEVAFVAMDLEERGYPEFCWRFLNRYLENSGDYEGVKLLRYYFVYRALVRAKIEALRVDQEYYPADLRQEYFATAFAYIELARRWALSHRAGLILMHGLAGSGKSTCAAAIARRLGAFQLRSDIVRKRLFELEADADSDSTLEGGIYSKLASERTYRRLRELARIVIDADFTIIVDATFLQQSQRREFLELSFDKPVNKLIIHCKAPHAVLRQRIRDRRDDPSEANLAVLERQLETRETITAAELEAAALIEIDEAGIGDQRLREIEAALAGCNGQAS